MKKRRKNRTFENYQQRNKFIFWELITNLSRFSSKYHNYGKEGKRTFKNYYLQGKFIFQWLVANFANFLWTHIFVQSIVHLRISCKEVHIQQLISNFVNFWRINSVFIQNKIILWGTRKIHISIISDEFCWFSLK